MKSGRASNASSESPHSVGLTEVSEVNVYFWIAEILATIAGETAAVCLRTTLVLGSQFTFVVTGALLVVALFAQFRVRRYVPAICWWGVLAISVAGSAFWVAYIVTRPFCAPLGDLLPQPADVGGLAIDLVNIAFLMVMAGLVAYLTMSRVDRIDDGTRDGVVREVRVRR